MTCCASCPKLKIKTNLRKILANKTKQGMRQIWITHVHILCSKNTQKTRSMKKNSKRKKVKK
jgi:hypothetical protein